MYVVFSSLPAQLPPPFLSVPDANHSLVARSRAILQVGDEIEIRPGILSKDADGRMRCRPIFSKIMSLFAEQNDLQFAVPGGLIGACALA